IRAVGAVGTEPHSALLDAVVLLALDIVDRHEALAVVREDQRVALAIRAEGQACGQPGVLDAVDPQEPAVAACRPEDELGSLGGEAHRGDALERAVLLLPYVHGPLLAALGCEGDALAVAREREAVPLLVAFSLLDQELVERPLFRAIDHREPLLAALAAVDDVL